MNLPQKYETWLMFAKDILKSGRSQKIEYREITPTYGGISKHSVTSVQDYNINAVKAKAFDEISNKIKDARIDIGFVRSAIYRSDVNDSGQAQSVEDLLFYLLK